MKLQLPDGTLTHHKRGLVGLGVNGFGIRHPKLVAGGSPETGHGQTESLGGVIVDLCLRQLWEQVVRPT
jgi:hypothetical protein